MSNYGVITGASSGIGAAFAELLAEEGYSLLLTGRRKERIESVADDLRTRFNVDVRVVITELAEEEQRASLRSRIGELERVDLLVNNAGFGFSQPFATDDPKLHYEMLDVHMRAPLELIETVLPGMAKRKSGGIINVASVAAFFPMPKASTYTATKAFLVSFTESLAMEVAGAGIDVQALCPGFTHTDFHERMGISAGGLNQRNLIGWMEPHEVCRRSLKKLRSDCVVYVPGLINKLLVRGVSHMPRWLYYPLLRAARENA